MSEGQAWRRVVEHPDYAALLRDESSPLAARRSQLAERLLSPGGPTDPHELGKLRGELVALAWLDPELLLRYAEPREVPAPKLHRAMRPPYHPHER